MPASMGVREFSFFLVGGDVREQNKGENCCLKEEYQTIIPILFECSLVTFCHGCLA